MKKSMILNSVVCGLLLLLTSGAFAANKGSLQVLSPATVAGTQLIAGNYIVQWEGTGSNVELQIKKGNKIVATTPAKLVPINHAFSNNASILNTAGRNAPNY